MRHRAIPFFLFTTILATLCCTPVKSETVGEIWAAFPTNFAAAAASAAWATCGGTPNAGIPSVVSQPLIDTVVCYAKSNGPNALNILVGLQRVGQSDSSTRYSFLKFDAPIYMAEMRVSILLHQLRAASFYGPMATKSADQYSVRALDVDASFAAKDEPTLFWDMLTPAMRGVLLAHGGTRTDNRDARPGDWKDGGPGVDIWIYKTGGAVLTTYIFTNGKLTRTLKP